MKTFYLPDLGEGLQEGIIREWYVKEGDKVDVDQPLVAIETAKALVDVPVPFGGTIAKLHGEAGDTIPTDAALVDITTDDISADKKPDTATATSSDNTHSSSTKPQSDHQDSQTVVGNIAATDTVIANHHSTTTTQKVGQQRPLASPATRLMAQQLNIDLNTIQGSGPEGEILIKDLTNHISPTARAQQHSHSLPQGETTMNQTRQAMAQAMQASHSEVVPVTIGDEADITSWYNDDTTKRNTTVMMIQAIIHAAAAIPIINSHYFPLTTSYSSFAEIHLGLAVDSDGALFVPVIKNAQSLNENELRSIIEEFKVKSNNKTFQPDNLKGATIVLSNYGAFGGRYATPIVVPPTVAIIGMGRCYETAGVSQGKISIRTMLPFNMSIDHRLCSGAEAARCIAHIKKFLQLDIES